MIVQHNPPLHLTYCLNIHPGESWDENFEAIRTKTVEVKQRVASDQWFGLGLRLGHHAASKLLSDPALIDEARDFFAEHQLYPFPFGSGERKRLCARLALTRTPRLHDATRGRLRAVSPAECRWQHQHVARLLSSVDRIGERSRLDGEEPRRGRRLFRRRAR
jgi:hypothetical protein